jgi:hypothetical protein
LTVRRDKHPGRSPGRRSGWLMRCWSHRASL